MKKIICLIAFIQILVAPIYGQTARVQIIHNSPDHIFEALDVYFGNQKMVDSLPFRHATAYMDVPANSPQVIAVQSPGLNDTVASLLRSTLTFDDDSSYVLIISGLLSTQPYDSLKPFELLSQTSREQVKTAGNVEAMFFHGGTDASGLVVNELTGNIQSFIPLLSYGQFTGYKSLAPQNYEFELVSNGIQQQLATYFANFSTLGLADSAIVVLASGMVDTSQSNPGDTNTSVDAPLFGLYAALSGGGPLVELPVKTGIGLDELNFNAVTAYPIPANNFMNLRLPGTVEGMVEFEILDMVGQPVMDFEVLNRKGELHRIDISAIKAGQYILNAKTQSNQSFSRRIVIE